MTWPALDLKAAILPTILLAGLLYLWRLNRALKATPPEVIALSPHRWTDEQIRESYQTVINNPISWAKHLPPKLDRRYIVTGGSGGVGGQIILHLLDRGQPPESIRNVDFRAPDEKDGRLRDVPFVRADISSTTSTEAAILAPWPEPVAKLPLTVFHVAAVIVVNERSMATFDRVKRVNVDGTENVLKAAQVAGADILIATSSASIALVPVRYWGATWRRWPENYWQVIDESDFDRPLKPHDQYFSNYAHSKAIAERLVCGANSPSFRTGTIRPGNGIYGNSRADQLVGMVLRAGVVPTWTRNILQNCVHAGHVSLAHLLFEAALANTSEPPACAGRPFVVTDSGPSPFFQDIYQLIQNLSVTPVKVHTVPPVPILLLAYLVEAMDSLSRVPGFAWAKPKGDLAIIQPSVLFASTHTPVSDAAIRKPISEGGLNFKGVCTTLEGMCQQLVNWNIEHGGQVQSLDDDNSITQMTKAAKNVGLMSKTNRA